MLKPLFLAAATLALSGAALVPAADAQRYDGRRDGAYDQSYRNGDDREARSYREYRGNDARYRAARQCRNGDGGTIIGAIAGGLLGRGVSGRGDHLLGTVLGAGAGALAGRAIDRSDRPDYCRR